jgi:adenosine deaminase
VPDLAGHPLRAMLERGLIVSINTDDPGVSAIDLPYEFEVAAPPPACRANKSVRPKSTR